MTLKGSMNTMGKAIDFLSEHQSATPSHWKNDAVWRRENASWLKYSRIITLIIHKSMDELSVTQAQLAERLGCTQQYVSSLLKGDTNFTLETIAKLEDALGIDILKSTMDKRTSSG